MCHPLYLRLQNQSLCSFFCLYLSQEKKKHISQQYCHSVSACVQSKCGRCVYFIFFLRAADELKASSVGVDAPPVATRGRCGGVLHLHTWLLLLHTAESGLGICSGRLRRNKYRSGLHVSFIIQIILCVILMHFQDQNDTVLIMLYISEGYAIINTDVGITSDDYIEIYIQYLECRPTTIFG